MANFNIQKVRKLMQTGQFRKALPMLTKACKAESNNAELLYLLGCSQAQSGLVNESISTLKKCLKLYPGAAQTHFALAGSYIALGDFKQAENHINESLKLNPSSAEAYVALANIRLSENNVNAANENINKALKINPDLSDAHLVLGKVSQKNHDFKQSILHLEKSIKLNPKSEEALYSMGSSLVNLARTDNKQCLDEAITYFQKAIRQRASYTEALTGLALAYDYNGEPDKAINIITPLLEKKIKNATLAVVFSHVCNRNDRCSEAREYINEILKQDKLSTDARKTLYMDSGKMLDKMGLYNEAFEHYKAGNDLDNQEYNNASHIKFVDSLISTFSPAFFEQAPTAKTRDGRPVFIVGMPRSGTSLTEQILCAHSQIFGAGELSLLDQLISQVANDFNIKKKFPESFERLNQDIVNTISEGYLSHLSELSSNAKRITDKMPFNYYFLGVIQIMFPDAHIIHCKRNPMDTCMSIYFQGFSEKHAYASNLYNIGENYLQYERLMEHWKQVITLPVYELNYEDLVSNQGETIRDLLEFCGLEWEEDCLNFYQLKRAVNTPSYDQVSKPLYTHSINRWKNYEAHLTDLKNALEPLN